MGFKSPCAFHHTKQSEEMHSNVIQKGRFNAREGKASEMGIDDLRSVHYRDNYLCRTTASYQSVDKLKFE